MSNSGESLPIVWRLRREGVDAGIYIHSSQYRHNYDMILEKITLKNLKKEIKKAEIVIFDITRPNEKLKHDIALLKTFGIKSSSSSVFGPVADKLKRDKKIIGASALTEDLELDRHKGIELARKMGFAIPGAPHTTIIWMCNLRDTTCDIRYTKLEPNQRLNTTLRSQRRRRAAELVVMRKSYNQIKF